MQEELSNTVESWLTEAEQCMDDGEVLNTQTFLSLAAKRAKLDNKEFVAELIKQVGFTMLVHGRRAAKEKITEIREELN